MNTIKKTGVIILLFCMFSCKPNINKTYIGENIPKNVKSEIKALNDELFKAIQEKNTENIKELMSESLLEKSNEAIDSMLLLLFSETENVNLYNIKNDFYIENSTKNVSNTIFSGLSDDYDYSFAYYALNEETYISMIIPETSVNELLIVCFYGKYKNEWKINILQFGLYSIQKLNTIDYYKQAKEQYTKGNLIDAANSMFLSMQCLKPTNYMQYVLESEIIDFNKTVLNEINQKYVLPYEIKDVNTKPVIINISPMQVDKGIFPLIEYKTNIPITDTVKLKIENDEIHKIIGNIFYGIDKDKKFLLYKAFSEIPDGSKPVDTYGFYKELK